jgi:phage terminase large subunit
VDGLVYENWKEEAFDLSDIKNAQTAFGLDFGYSVDATAFVVAYIDLDEKKIYIYDELYQTKMSNRMIFDEIQKMGYSKERIIADSAEPKSIDELRGLGLRRIEAAKKGKDSISNGIQFIQNFEIVIHPRCTNFITEVSNYTWDKDKFGNQINRPIDDFNHCLDALRYGCERYAFKNKWIT